MGLKDKLVEDMKTALKSRDSLTLSVIRLARAAIVNEEIRRGKELEDSEVMEVLAREIKLRKEAIVEYERGERMDLAEKERKEMEILGRYMPEQLTEEEIRELAQATIAEVGALGAKDMGKVMGALMPKVRGRADGKVVNQVVRELLGG